VGLAIFGVRLGQACAQLTHVWVKFSRVAQRRFLTAPFFNSTICVSSHELSPNPSGEAENGSDCHSQCLDPLLRGRTERFGCGWNCPTPVGLDCLNMETFVG
jgi:hypothetical protein